MSQPKKVIHSRGTSYEITVEGRMVRRRFPTRQSGMDAAACARSEIVDGLHIAPAEGRTTVAAYVARWLPTLQVRAGTLHNHEIYLHKHVLPVLGSAQPGVPAALRHPGAGRAAVPQGLDATDRRQHQQDHRHGDAVSGLRPPHPGLPPLQDQGSYAPGAGPDGPDPRPGPAPARRARPRDRAVLALAVGTGMRQGEALGVRLANLDLLRRAARHRGAVRHSPDRPALHHARPQDASQPAARPLPQFAVDAVAAHLQDQQVAASGALFISPPATSGDAAASTSRSGSQPYGPLTSKRGTGSTPCGTPTPRT